MKKIHYFQRYHGRENVHTANAMSLISKLYEYKPRYFYQFLEEIVGRQAEYNFDIEIGMQENNRKTGNSIPDAIIQQSGYRFCIEAKIDDWFYEKQLAEHVNTFKTINGGYKILLTLSNASKIKIESDILHLVESFNKEQALIGKERLIYIHKTFEDFINIIRDSILQDRDYEFETILDDYEEYCYDSKLIDAAYKTLKIRAVGETIETNVRLRLYYNGACRGYAGHKYLGIYKGKAVQYIGEIKAVVKAKLVDDKLCVLSGNPTEEEKDRIFQAISDGDSHNYDLRNVEQNYFLVDRFVKTNFVKTSKGGIFSERNINLENECEGKDIRLLSIDEIAEVLSAKTWE